MNRYERWHGRVVWLGIILNMFDAAIGIIPLSLLLPVVRDENRSNHPVALK
ncbi:MAG: hypothetical protein U1F76_32020 [Candidatus Competibacteraceae bacterium]